MPRRIGESNSPAWIPRADERFSLEEPMSPPSYDDSFFLIRFPLKASAAAGSSDDAHAAGGEPESSVRPSQAKSINQSLRDAFEDHGAAAVAASSSQLHFSQECRKYLSGGGDEDAKNHFHDSSKPKGTDDDFKTAACAGTLVKVAQQFVQSSTVRSINTGKKRFTVAQIKDHDEHATSIEQEQDNLETDPKLMQRRNSKSLPASPLTSPMSSPKFARKFQPNPYFTITGPPEERKPSWLLASFLGARKDLSSSTVSVSSQIVEETSPAGSVGSLVDTNKNSMPSSKNGAGAATAAAAAAADLKAKPTMLREMNFWAPTSY